MYCQNCGMMNDKGAKFCKKCGKKMKKPKGNKNGVKIFVISILLILIVALIIGIVNTLNSNKVYFSDEVLQNDVTMQTAYVTNSVENNTISNTFSNNTVDTNTTVTNQTTQSTSKSYKTTIVDDNFYSNVDINSKEDVIELIEEDSENQKSNTEEEIQEVEERIVNNYKVCAVNFGELDLETAEGIEDVVKYIYDNYPTAREGLTNITINNTSINESYIAAMGPFNFVLSSTGNSMGVKTIIHLNSSYFLNIARFEKAVDDSCEAGWFPENATTYSSVIHEFGHYLTMVIIINKYGLSDITYIDENNMNAYSQIINDWSNDIEALSIIEEAYDNYLAKYSDNIAFDDFRASISQYAVATDDYGEYIYAETIAEAFHDCYLNGNNAAKASIEIVNVLNERLEEI